MVEIAAAPLDTNGGLIDTPGPVRWLEMTAQPLLEFGTVALDPAPHCRVVHLQAAFAEHLFDIAERERVPQVSAHGVNNQLGLALSPLEDRRSDCLLMISSGYQPPLAKVATQPYSQTSPSPSSRIGRVPSPNRRDPPRVGT